LSHLFFLTRNKTVF